MMNKSCIQHDLLSDDIVIAFWLSFSMLLLISILKYFVNNKSNYKGWVEMILELPIDVCTIFITMLISLTFNNNPQNTFVAIFGVLIAVVLCCYFRKKSQFSRRNFPFSSFRDTNISPPAGVYFKALLRRLKTTRAIFSLSATTS